MRHTAFIKKTNLIKDVLFLSAIIIFLISLAQIAFAADYYRVDGRQTTTVDVCFKCPGECCRIVVNNSDSDLFIPTKTCTEWDSFRTHRPDFVNLNICPSPLSTPPVSCLTTSPYQINVSWDNVANETGYRIYRCTGPVCTPTINVHSALANITLWGDGGLSSNTSYGYRVRAHNVSGESGWSNTARCQTQPEPPEPEPECHTDRDCGRSSFECIDDFCTARERSYSCIMGRCFPRTQTHTCVPACCPPGCGGPHEPPCPC